MVLRSDSAGKQEILMLVSDYDVSSNDLKAAYVSRNAETLLPCLDGVLSSQGGMKMGLLTKGNLDRRLGIVFDDTLVTAPVVRAEVRDRFQMTGNFTQEEVELMAAILRTGAFPARLVAEPVSEEQINPK
jgi:preprotein translocase subunit SecD